MKACSFLPAATNIIYELGLEDYLFGVTFECPSDKPNLVRSYLEGREYSSKEIDLIVSRFKSQGRSLYYINEELLRSISPDVIFTQDVCDVCQIDTGYVHRGIASLDKEPLLAPLTPHSLNDVYENILTVAKTLGEENRGYKLLASLKKRTDSIVDSLRAHNAPLRRALLMEWINPIYNCGHWIPFQIAQAGGVDMLSNPSGYSTITSWDRILRYDPEVIIIAPCGFRIERTIEEFPILINRPGWDHLTAVKNAEVFIADGNLFTEPSARLVNGIELLASSLHPTIFRIPTNVKDKVVSYTDAFTKLRV